MARAKKKNPKRGLYNKLDSDDKKAYLASLKSRTPVYGNKSNRQNFLNNLANSPEYKKVKKRQQVKKKGAL
jgi:ABC-type uncharacterized transport system ATPase subunit